MLDVKVKLQPDRVVVSDRLYYRPLFGALEFPRGVPEGYFLIAGETYRPTEHEVSGGVDIPTDLEPFRSITSGINPGPWTYSDDALIEVVDEHLERNYRSLLEAVVEYSDKYSVSVFWCAPGDRDLAGESTNLLSEIYRRRVGRQRRRNWLRDPEVEAPVILPLPIGNGRGGGEDYLNGLLRSQIASGLLRINSECRHLLSQNPSALKALSFAAYAGTGIRLRLPKVDDGGIPEVNTYH
ncbi:MAG: hypothetical protein JRJ35_12110 [Deltaproteobacteria bacterium]|nr:hypothetical protein [Deltaproteobacteria bacterium]MBW2007750.1 hypothetical protein [Deltaproteobacteria bacterium]